MFFQNLSAGEDDRGEDETPSIDNSSADQCLPSEVCSVTVSQVDNTATSASTSPSGMSEPASAQAQQIVVSQSQSHRSAASSTPKTGVTSGKKKSSVMKEEDNALRAISNAIRVSSEKTSSVKTTDEYDVYGTYIASELRSIPDQFTRDYVKHEFSQILFQAKWMTSSAASGGGGMMIQNNCQPSARTYPTYMAAVNSYQMPMPSVTEASYSGNSNCLFHMMMTQ